MRVFIRALLAFGIKEDEVRVILPDNPVKLMWLDGEVGAMTVCSRGLQPAFGWSLNATVWRNRTRAEARDYILD
jgi:hypothetical protein